MKKDLGDFNLTPQNLPTIQAVPEDDNPKQQHGYVSVCKKCGYVFHIDNWRLKETIEIDVNGKKGKIDVSTVYLDLDHFGNHYETMFFQSENSEVDFELEYQFRYKTKEEAEETHNKFVKELKGGNYKIIPTRYTFILNRDTEQGGSQ